MHTAYIALGSNQGDRELNLLRGVAEIGRLPGSKISALSGFYETEPVGTVPQENFFNAVLRLETDLPPEPLLHELLRIESEVFLRTREVPGGPRRMDLDLLLYNDLVLQTADLTLPHPRLHERRFVLAPLAEIAPKLRHPVLHEPVSTLLSRLPRKPGIRKLEEPTWD